MLATAEAFFLRRGDQFAVDEKARRGVVKMRRNADDVQAGDGNEDPYPALSLTRRGRQADNLMDPAARGSCAKQLSFRVRKKRALPT